MTLRTGILSLFVALGLVGCQNGSTTETVSPSDDVAALNKRLLRQEQALAKLQAEVAALRADRYELQQLLKETRQLLQSLEETGKVPPEKRMEFRVVRVEIGFLTCAIDTDGKKGDDAIAAYVYLYDQDGSSIKRAGSFRFELFDLSRAEDQVIGVWTYPPEVAAKHWQRFPSGFQFKLPFAGPPTARKTILKVTFSRPGEAPMTATRNVTVELP